MGWNPDHPGCSRQGSYFQKWEAFPDTLRYELTPLQQSGVVGSNLLDFGHGAHRITSSILVGNDLFDFGAGAHRITCSILVGSNLFNFGAGAHGITCSILVGKHLFDFGAGAHAVLNVDLAVLSRGV